MAENVKTMALRSPALRSKLWSMPPATRRRPVGDLPPLGVAQVSILAFPGVQILDVAGPLEVLSMTMHRAFKRGVRVTPGQYRRHFRGQPERGTAAS